MRGKIAVCVTSASSESSRASRPPASWAQPFLRALGIECVGRVEHTFNPNLQRARRSFPSWVRWGALSTAAMHSTRPYPTSISTRPPRPCPGSNCPPSPRPTTPLSVRWKSFALRTATTYWCAGRRRESTSCSWNFVKALYPSCRPKGGPASPHRDQSMLTSRKNVSTAPRTEMIMAAIP